MPDGDALPDGWRIGQVAADGIVESQLSLLCQQQHAGRGELLSDGARLKHRLRYHRHGMFDVGKTISFGLHDLPMFYDREGHSRNLLSFHFAADKPIDRVCACDGNVGQGEQQAKNQPESVNCGM